MVPNELCCTESNASELACLAFRKLVADLACHCEQILRQCFFNLAFEITHVPLVHRRAGPFRRHPAQARCFTVSLAALLQHQMQTRYTATAHLNIIKELHCPRIVFLIHLLIGCCPQVFQHVSVFESARQRHSLSLNTRCQVGL